MNIPFRFDGHPYEGRPGDTLAAALLRSGPRILGRSFKYHRPRGLWGAWVEEPNILLDVLVEGVRLPNCRATTTPLTPGLEAFSVNAAPDAARDRLAIIDRFARFLPAGFYYKTFLWPTWHAYEPRIRALAGLGRLDPDQGWATPPAEQRHAGCDLLVIGAGPAGLTAARAAAEAGLEVVLADDREAPGGSLIDTGATVDGQPPAVWAAAQKAAFEAAGGRILARTTVIGAYDHGLALLAEARPLPTPPRLWRLRAARTILATGAMERPLTFPDNDRPGILSAHAALAYLHRHGVLAGRAIVLATTQDDAAGIAEPLRAAGAEVQPVTIGEDAAWIAGIDWSGGAVQAVRLADGRRLAGDTLLVSGGWTPRVHLHSQTGGKLDWRDDLQAFVPRPDRPSIIAIGAAAGQYDPDRARQDALVAARGDRPAPREAGRPVRAAWPRLEAKGRQWVDFQNDVTVKDVVLAHRENFRSVEHLKRYTTLGMANDQGKTSNMAGLAVMAGLEGAAIPDLGTTTFRPPYDPVSLQTLAGRRRGDLFAPVKRLALEPQHRAAGAHLRAYGGWLRPAWYGDRDAIAREVRIARERAALFDGSPLGKIEVIGPDAERFLDFIYYNTVATLKPGRARYGFMLTEGGKVFDDGVLFRLAEDRFVVSCSSSHVEAVATALTIWRQDQFDPARVHIHDTTPHWTTLTVTGPTSKRVLEALDLPFDLDDAALPHMAVAEADGLRLARVSFTGDRSYELSLPARRAEAFWSRIRAAGADVGLGLLGSEALLVMRQEKGLIIVGKDTDGTTLPQDLGLAGPRARKQGDYVGKRSLFTEEATRPGRRQLVGLDCDGSAPLPVGGHIVAQAERASQGYVTSACFSPTLNRPIALGLVRDGAGRMGETVEVYHLGARRPARIAPLCAFDPSWERLHA